MTDELLNIPVVPVRRGFPRPFGQYILEKNLSRGGMGEVHLAVARGLNTRCVIKTIRGDLTGDKEFIGRFADEAKIMVRISHPNIIRVFDCGKFLTDYYIAMEYLHGRDLGDILDRAYERGEPLPKEYGLFLTKEILRGLDYAHNLTDEKGRPMKLVHRDISPQNILVGFDGSVKLIDFGLARSELLPARTQGALAVGKYGYMSPEQARHEKIDGRADIYSVGVMLFEVFTSDRLVDEQDQATLWSRVLNPKHRRPSTVVKDLPREIDDLVMRAVEVRPDDRFADARAMLRHVEGFRTRSAERADLVDYLRVLYPTADFSPPAVPTFDGEFESSEQSMIIARSDEAAKSVFGRGQLPVEWTRQVRLADINAELEGRKKRPRDEDLRKWTDDAKEQAAATLIHPTHSPEKTVDERDVRVARAPIVRPAESAGEDPTRIARAAEPIPSGSLADFQRTAYYATKTRVREPDAGAESPSVPVARAKFVDPPMRGESFRDDEATVMMSAPPGLSWGGDTVSREAGADTRISVSPGPAAPSIQSSSAPATLAPSNRDAARAEASRAEAYRVREIREKNSAAPGPRRPPGAVGRAPLDNEPTAQGHERTAEVSEPSKPQPLILVGVMLMGLAVVVLLVVLIFGT